MEGGAGFPLDRLGMVPRILLTTDGTLTHILEAYACEPVYLVKLLQALVDDPARRAAVGLEGGERALRRIILLRGAKSDTPFVYADSVVLLDRLPPPVRDGLLETDTPIGKLLYSCRAETLREITAMAEEHAPEVAAHFGVSAAQAVLSRTYRVVLAGRPVAHITEKFPASSFPDSPFRRIR